MSSGPYPFSYETRSGSRTFGAGLHTDLEFPPLTFDSPSSLSTLWFGQLRKHLSLCGEDVQRIDEALGVMAIRDVDVIAVALVVPKAHDESAHPAASSTSAP